MYAIELDEIETWLFGLFRRYTSETKFPDFKSPQVIAGYKSLEAKGLVSIKLKYDGSLLSVSLTEKGWSML